MTNFFYFVLLSSLFSFSCGGSDDDKKDSPTESASLEDIDSVTGLWLSDEDFSGDSNVSIAADEISYVFSRSNLNSLWSLSRAGLVSNSLGGEPEGCKIVSDMRAAVEVNGSDGELEIISEFPTQGCLIEGTSIKINLMHYKKITCKDYDFSDYTAESINEDLPEFETCTEASITWNTRFYRSELWTSSGTVAYHNKNHAIGRFVGDGEGPCLFTVENSIARFSEKCRHQMIKHDVLNEGIFAGAEGTIPVGRIKSEAVFDAVTTPTSFATLYESGEVTFSVANWNGEGEYKDSGDVFSYSITNGSETFTGEELCFDFPEC